MDVTTKALVTSDQSYNEAASNIGNGLSKAEDQTMKAFSLSETDTAGIKALAKELGAKEPEKMTLEGLRILAKHVLDKAQSAYEMLSQLFAAKKKAEDAVINNIR
jgi:hypothetical protein